MSIFIFFFFFFLKMLVAWSNTIGNQTIKEVTEQDYIFS